MAPRGFDFIGLPELASIKNTSEAYATKNREPAPRSRNDLPPQQIDVVSANEWQPAASKTEHKPVEYVDEQAPGYRELVDALMADVTFGP